MKLVVLFSFIFLYACNANNNNVHHKNNSPVEYLKNQITSYPDSVELRMQLIDVLDSMKLYKEALFELDVLIKKDSFNAENWYYKAQLYEKSKDTVAAIINYKRAIRIYPSPDNILTLANLYAEYRNDTALILCVEIETTYTDKKYSADCMFIAGVYYARTGNFTKAMELFDLCINNSYSYIVAYLEKGFIYYDNKDYKKALEIFKLSAQVNATYADSYYWQAKCYEALNDKQNAISNYEKALILDKNLQEAEVAIKRLK
ncbi:MAG TPA: tetratricopeptide repeat protein [Chitinophagaceae bacterium]|nr:tetratricopeptide repeat protein [Chitinophagaceae bacterium]MCC6635660.1 tetratricopeptide repeat protein [Chitinophagaceae bacterium]HMZ45460.1 tetratricopeptide repeat protein [Chitinophagaceae bacterium]HNE93229.1 tetratricopeptide repeat protein [Chitinophagaceae bacterium]HNF29062.1 tetratricopeptide repeat protein [Chitinophagaceae bacterium]